MNLNEHIQQVKQLSKIIKSQKNVIDKIIAENNEMLEADYPGLIADLAKSAKNVDIKAIKKHLEILENKKESNGSTDSNNRP